jgi:hypothetical protein
VKHSIAGRISSLVISADLPLRSGWDIGVLGCRCFVASKYLRSFQLPTSHAFFANTARSLSSFHFDDICEQKEKKLRPHTESAEAYCADYNYDLNTYF